MDDLVERYNVLKDEGEQEGRRIREKYRDCEEIGRQTALETTDYGLSKQLDLLNQANSSTGNDWPKRKAKARIFGFDITDRVRQGPFTVLSGDDQDEFLWIRAYFDDRPIDYQHPHEFQYERAQRLYDEFGTLVSNRDWEAYLRDQTVSQFQSDLFTDLREIGVGDRLRYPDQ